MPPPSLTRSQEPSSGTIATPPPRSSFLQQFVNSPLFNTLLRPREHLYGSLDEAPAPQVDISRRTEDDGPHIERHVSIDSSEDDPCRLPTPSSDSFPTHPQPEQSNGNMGKNMLSHLRAQRKPAVSVSRRPRARPRTETPKRTTRSTTKSKKDSENDAKSKKRPTPEGSDSKDRAPKVQKTKTNDVTTTMKAKPRAKANTKKKVDNVALASPYIDLTVSDDEDDEDDEDDMPLITRFARRKGFCSQLRLSSFNNSASNEDDDAKPAVSGNEDPVPPIQNVLQNNWSFANINNRASNNSDSELTPPGAVSFPASTPTLRGASSISSSSAELLKAETSRANDLEEELERVKREHSDELKRLRAEWEAEKYTETLLNRELNQDIAELRTNQQKLDQELASAREENSKLKARLEEAEGNAGDLETERDELQEDLNAERKKSGTVDDLQAENAALKAERGELQEELDTERKKNYTLADLQVENATLKAALKKEQEEHEELMRTLDDTKYTTSAADTAAAAAAAEAALEQVSTLQATNAALTKELESLKEAKRSTLSPAPSSSCGSCSTEDQLRENNVRKIYLKVKRRYDHLQSVAVNLNTCTRGMDLTSFGEFGAYLKQLKVALDESKEEAREKGKASAAVPIEAG